MNEQIRQLIKQADLDDDMFPVDEGWEYPELKKFAELIVEECCNRLGKETIRHDGYGYNQHELYRRLREHFGVAK
jgi:hypothetical protein